MTNHLGDETSPYLLQHIHNPVDWHPWGEEALALARAQNKPILLSIGYSACHWCHVMAHESFEDVEVAAAMNLHFVNIKVDREERPDLDQIYQAALYIMTGRNGGWPLTMFLTPKQKPFFGGTYFPKLPRYGVTGLLDLLPRIAEAYYTRGAEIEQQSAAVLESLAARLPSKPTDPFVFSKQLLVDATADLKNRFDAEHGGFGGVPKFLHPTELEFCLRHYWATKDQVILNIAVFSLEKMAKGGIYDQIGGGFCRYSTDQQWSIPHFEKMLYDNAPLLRLYSDAWLITSDPLFKRVVEESAEWVTREMQSLLGGYYSTIDADSENEEGRFYVWERANVERTLLPEEYAVVAPYYGLLRPPNFERQYWNLEIVQPMLKTAEDAGMCQAEAQQRLTIARSKLFVERESRVHPGRDEKILTSWNGLMIKGMAHAGRVFGRSDWVRSAAEAADFIRSTLWRDGVLLATCKDGKAHLNAYLDDYAFLLDGLLELMQAEFRQVDLDFAVALAEVLLEQFEDEQSGGFFFTGHQHEKLIHRPKSGHDNSVPSGNGVAAYSLQRLGHLIGETRYLKTAERTISLFYPVIQRHSSSCCSLLTALEEALTPPQVVILRGSAENLTGWQEALLPISAHTMVLAVPSGVPDLPVSLNKPVEVDGAVNAWVCQGVRCLPKISDLQDLLRICEVRGRIKFPLQP